MSGFPILPEPTLLWPVGLTANAAADLTVDLTVDLTGPGVLYNAAASAAQASLNAVPLGSQLAAIGAGGPASCAFRYSAASFQLRVQFESGERWERSVTSNLPVGAALVVWIFLNGFLLETSSGRAAQFSFFGGAG